ncbi:unnamed protein product [Pedinophyceae sp. YPF-701]|nr:unnamed protein product [Pedinophyceae sp. YPF-701]
MAAVMEINLQNSRVTGQVVSQNANFVHVKVSSWEGVVGPDGAPWSDDAPPRGEILCVCRGLLRKRNQRPIVGDRVNVESIDWVDGRGVVQSIGDRDSVVEEPLVANVDHIVIALGVHNPPLDPVQAMKFLASAHGSKLPVTVVLNKCDLLPPDELRDVVRHVESWGYEPLAISVRGNLGLDAVMARLRGRVSVIAGPSGVGKSSLINALRLKALGVDVDAARDEADRLREAAEERLAALTAGGGDGDGEDEEEGVEGGGGADAGGAGPRGELEEGGELSYTQGLKEYKKGEWKEARVALGGGGASLEDLTEAELEDLVEGVAGGGRQWYELRHGGVEVELLRTGRVSDVTGRGRHTTRTVSLIDLPGGGLLADTPGFNIPSMANVALADLDECFPDIQDLFDEHGACRFSDCTHSGEPGCVVAEHLSPERLEVYLTIRAEVAEREEVEARRSMGKRRREGAGTIKRKAGKGDGNSGRAEVRLEPKRFRRQNRRTARQTIEETMDIQEWR